MSETRSQIIRIARPAGGTTTAAGHRRGTARRVRSDQDPQPAGPAAGAAAARYDTQTERVLSTHWAVMLDASSQAWTRDVNGLLTHASAVALAQAMRASGQTAHVQATVTMIIDYAS